MAIQLLIQRLEQKVQHLYQDYLPQREEKIFAKFDRSLFLILEATILNKLIVFKIHFCFFT